MLFMKVKDASSNRMDAELMSEQGHCMDCSGLVLSNLPPSPTALFKAENHISPDPFPAWRWVRICQWEELE